ncbi:MAG: hypothetical protein KF901_18130 [Myxococcales bacterium]|nr:hypothetical protein [Myxococcales bacterium]
MRNVVVLRIERAPRPHARVEIAHDRDTLFMVAFSGGQGGFATSPMPPPSTWRTHGDFEGSWTGLIREVTRMLQAEPLQGTSVAALVGVDFDRGVGVMIGAIGAYQERAGAIDVCADQTLGAKLHGAAPVEASMFRAPLAWLTPRGLEGEMPPSRFVIGQGALILSSVPLHWHTRWEPTWPAGVLAACELERNGEDLTLAVISPHA